MNNEVIVAEATGEVIEKEVSTVKIVPLEITVKRDLKSKQGNRTFDIIEVKLVLPVIRDGKNIGKGIRKVSLKFGEKAFEDKNTTDFKSEKDLKSGILFVMLEGLSPIYNYYEKGVTNSEGRTYYVQDVNPKTNKKQSLYVNYGLCAFKPYTTEESAFDLAGYRESKALEAIETDELPEDVAETE